MALERMEQEILDGSRSWAKTQELFRGLPDSTRTRHSVGCTWYSTSVSEYEGAFCMVQEGGDLEDLIGEFVAVTYNRKTIYLYCVGAAAFEVPFAVTRLAFLLGLADLSQDSIPVTVQALV